MSKKNKSITKGVAHQIRRKCANCGETDRIWFDIHHKDRNRQNNKLSNLQI